MAMTVATSVGSMAPKRVTRYLHKALIVVGILLLTPWLITAALDDRTALDATGITVVVETGLLWLVTRDFRGDSEDLVAPRAWWRMTEFPTMSFIAAAYCAFGIVINLHSMLTWGADFVSPLQFVGLTMLGALFLISGVLLVRAGVTAKRVR
ncbi:hypothetical protein [Plantibacter sp. YIM 135249]|uniref:hypothetical protein n=1 Tax=Plantibacter sp. YIM 135249 TaxID=3423918 RepID=UPI003D33582B